VAIISSRREVSDQANGWFHVVERHVDEFGHEYMRTFFAPPKADLDALLAQHAAEQEVELARVSLAEKEHADAREMEAKLIAYALEQPVEILRVAVKLSDDEIAVLQKRETAVKAVDAEAIIRG